MKAGNWLYASCSATYYRVAAAGKDANGNDCVTIEVDDLDDFLFGDDDWKQPNLMYVEPSAAVLHDVPWRAVPSFAGLDYVELNTPIGGCYRCTRLFSVKDRRDDAD